MNQTYTDNKVTAPNGVGMLLLGIVLGIIAAGFLLYGLFNANFTNLVIGGCFAIVAFVIFIGLTQIYPNVVVVTQLFGQYSGTVTNTGLVFINPLMTKHHVSIKIDNFSNEPIKVNDKNGNPLNMSSMFEWRVKDAAKALFSVEDYQEFIQNQVEGILAQIAAMYPYDTEIENQKSFRKNISEISNKLKEMLQERVQECGLEIVDVRFNHIAYAVEIAAAMLKKQQAEAMLDARKQIVDGARRMVEELLSEFDKSGQVKFSNEDKVKMTTNLMTVLVSENGTQPVITV